MENDLKELKQKIFELESLFFKSLSKFNSLKDFFDQKEEILSDEEISEFLCILVKDKVLDSNFGKSKFELINEFIPDKQGGIDFDFKINFFKKEVTIHYLSSERSGPWMIFDCTLGLSDLYLCDVSDMAKCKIETFIEDEDRMDSQPRRKHENAGEIKEKIKDLFNLLKEKYINKKV